MFLLLIGKEWTNNTPEQLRLEVKKYFCCANIHTDTHPKPVNGTNVSANCLHFHTNLASTKQLGYYHQELHFLCAALLIKIQAKSNDTCATDKT